MLYISTQTMM